MARMVRKQQTPTRTTSCQPGATGDEKGLGAVSTANDGVSESYFREGISACPVLHLSNTGDGYDAWWTVHLDGEHAVGAVRVVYGETTARDLSVGREWQ